MVGGVITGSCSTAPGLAPPSLLSVRALSDAADAFETWVDNRLFPEVRFKADESDDEWVGRCCEGGDRDGEKWDEDVFGGESFRLDVTLRDTPVRSS